LVDDKVRLEKERQQLISDLSNNVSRLVPETKKLAMSKERWLSMFVYEALTNFGWNQKAVETYDYEAFLEYYNDGYSPFDALREDSSYGEEEVG
jgi:hypothetical protein